MKLVDWLFYNLLKILARIIRLFIPKPQFGSVDVRKIERKRNEN